MDVVQEDCFNGPSVSVKISKELFLINIRIYFFRLETNLTGVYM